MKAKLALVLFAAALLLPSTGCASAADRVLFDIQTNYVEQVNVSVDGLGRQSFVTNLVPRVTVTPRAAVNTLVESTAPLAGPWGTFIGVAITALLGWWARFRQKRINDEKTTVNEVLVQSVEVARALLKRTPQGQEVDAKYVEWLKNNQQANDVLLTVRDLVAETVRPGFAAQDAQAIAAAAAAPKANP